MTKASSTRSLWKAVERRICAKLGAERTPLSGSNSKITAADCIHDDFYVEIKHRAKIPFYTAWIDAKKKADKEGKTPIFVMHEKGKQTSIVFMDLDDFIEIKNIF